MSEITPDEKGLFSSQTLELERLKNKYSYKSSEAIDFNYKIKMYLDKLITIIHEKIK